MVWSAMDQSCAGPSASSACLPSASLALLLLSDPPSVVLSRLRGFTRMREKSDAACFGTYGATFTVECSML